jgi:hypothetical protein
MSISWACAWPTPPSTVSAAIQQAKSLVIFFLVKNQNIQETGHNCPDFASKQPVTDAFSDGPVKKGNTSEPMAALCR